VTESELIMTLTISHEAAAGTLIDGTAQGDGSAEPLRGNGWRWSRNLGSWYLPHSRDREPKTHVIERTADQLRATGFDVEISIDITRRATTDIEADLLERRDGRAAALDASADRKAHAAAAENERAARALRRLPEGGEPIHVGHHSEAGHRNAIAKADAAMHRSADADREARQARARADIAAGGNDARYAPVTVANRIEKLRSEQASIRRRIAGHTRTLPGGYMDVTAPATGAYAERLERELTATTDALEYWRAVRAEQVTTGQVTDYSRETIKPGDLIRYFGSWHQVIRANPKSVTIRDSFGHPGTVPYTHIREHRTTGDETTS